MEGLSTISLLLYFTHFIANVALYCNVDLTKYGIIVYI